MIYRIGHFLILCVAVLTLPFFLCVYWWQTISAKRRSRHDC